MFSCLGAAAVQVEEVVEVVQLVLGVEAEVVAVLVGSSSGPPSQSHLVPRLRSWWEQEEPQAVAPHLSLPPPPVATPPLALTLP
jgi:hypothetical protein